MRVTIALHFREDRDFAANCLPALPLRGRAFYCCAVARITAARWRNLPLRGGAFYRCAVA
jgi:hypothetical protein